MTVPWAIGSNGALHSGEVARTLAYAATAGAEGIISFGDMAVKQLGTPGTSVQISPGAAVMLNRSPGGAHQSYIDRELNTINLAIAATTSGGSRSDLIVRRVEDPDYPGWSIPADPVNGPYGRYAVISGVAANTITAKQLNLGYPAIALARVTLPASTATVLTSHIVDLRRVANPRRERQVDAVFPGVAVNINTPGWKALATSRAIEVPEWATAATVRAEFTGLGLRVASAAGSLASNFAALAGQATFYDENWLAPLGTYGRSTYSALGEIAIPANIRDTNQTLIWYGARSSGTGYLALDTGSSLFADIEFLEKAGQ